MAYCPSVCSYRVIFSDGTIMFPKIPGHVNVQQLAMNYAMKTLTPKANTPVTVVSIESLD